MFTIILDETHVKSLDRSFFTQSCGNLLYSSHHILDVFFNTPILALATSPWQVYSRTGSAASNLLRMAQIDGTVPIPHLKIREYLRKLAKKLDEILQRYRIRTVALTLSLVNNMLKWYFENIEPNLPAEHQAAQAQLPPQQPQPHPEQQYQQQQHQQLVQLSPPPLPPQVSPPPLHQPYPHHMQHQQMHYSQHPSPTETVDITMHATSQLNSPNVWGQEVVHQQWSGGGFDITPHEITTFLQGTDGQMMFGPPEGLMHFQSGGDGSGGGGSGGGGGGEGGPYWQ